MPELFRLRLPTRRVDWSNSSEVKELPEAPDGEVAAIMKSANVNAAAVEWDSVPLVPVMVSV